MKYRSLAGRLPLALAGLLLLAATPTNAKDARLAISGYDPVAYFTDSKPVPGQSKFAYVWQDARWQFASAAHRKLFVNDPDHYAPQYGGYCAMGMSWQKNAHKDIPNPHEWAIVDGKLYLTHSEFAMHKWQKNPTENIRRADANWPRVKQEATVYDGYPNVKE